MRKSIFFVFSLCSILFFLPSCKKAIAPIASTGLLEQAKTFYQRSAPVSNKLEPDWSKAVTRDFSFGKGLLVPDTSHERAYFTTSFGGNHLFPSKGNRTLLVYQDSDQHWQASWIHAYPDSNAYTAGRGFSGIRVAKGVGGEWQEGFQYTFLRPPLPILPSQANTAAAHTILYIYSSGYNYGALDPDNGYYWQTLIGCIYVEDGSQGEGNAGSWYPFNAADLAFPTLDTGTGPGGAPFFDLGNLTIPAGNNVIGNIADYNKCFDNIAGSGHQYAVTVCVEQPVPGSRDAWGFTRTVVNNSSDLVSGGHTFLVLYESSATGTIIRNVGFYPKFSASPVSPIDQGQLVNDGEHDYNISLSIELTNSQFTQMLDFLGHGNDPGYQYNLNTNNCTSFAITALRRAGLNFQFTSSDWLNGGGYNPGDMGEDIRSMPLQQGMTRSLNPVNHPNTGICY